MHDGAAFEVPGVPGVRFTALAVAGKPAPYSAGRAAPAPGDNVALVLAGSDGRSAVYAPGLAAPDERLWAAMRTAACVLIDGTFWSDDEMIRLGLSGKRARDMGHLPLAGPGGMLEWLGQLPGNTRKILIHVNNSNPILDEDSAEHAELAPLGIELAFDGMEIAL
jgi:pyrroloquinoline quinone biosynthesis protein B